MLNLQLMLRLSVVSCCADVKWQPLLLLSAVPGDGGSDGTAAPWSLCGLGVWPTAQSSAATAPVQQLWQQQCQTGGWWDRPLSLIAVIPWHFRDHDGVDAAALPSVADFVVSWMFKKMFEADSFILMIVGSLTALSQMRYQLTGRKTSAYLLTYFSNEP